MTHYTLKNAPHLHGQLLLTVETANMAERACVIRAFEAGGWKYAEGSNPDFTISATGKPVDIWLLREALHKDGITEQE